MYYEGILYMYPESKLTKNKHIIPSLELSFAAMVGRAGAFENRGGVFGQFSAAPTSWLQLGSKSRAKLLRPVKPILLYIL